MLKFNWRVFGGSASIIDLGLFTVGLWVAVVPCSMCRSKHYCVASRGRDLYFSNLYLGMRGQMHRRESM